VLLSVAHTEADGDVVPGAFGRAAEVLAPP